MEDSKVMSGNWKLGSFGIDWEKVFLCMYLSVFVSNVLSKSTWEDRRLKYKNISNEFRSLLPFSYAGSYFLGFVAVHFTLRFRSSIQKCLLLSAT